MDEDNVDLSGFQGMLTHVHMHFLIQVHTHKHIS